MATACRMAGKAYFTMKVVVFSTVLSVSLFRSFVGQGMEVFCNCALKEKDEMINKCHKAISELKLEAIKAKKVCARQLKEKDEIINFITEDARQMETEWGILGFVVGIIVVALLFLMVVVFTCNKWNTKVVKNNESNVSEYRYFCITNDTLECYSASISHTSPERLLELDYH